MGTGFMLKEMLREKGMTIKALSQQSGISLNTLYSITKRDSDNVDPVIIRKIANALGCLPGELTTPARAASIGAAVADMDHRKWIEGWMDDGYTFSGPENDLIYAFSQMNDEGQFCAVRLVQDLAQVPKYKKPSGGGPRAVDPQEND